MYLMVLGKAASCLVVYIDNLIIRLESQAVGCYWLHYFVGTLLILFNASKIQPARFSTHVSSPIRSLAATFLFEGQYLISHLPTEPGI